MTDSSLTDPAPAWGDSPPSTPRSGIRGLLPDLSPWRESHDFRLLWCSRTVTSLGSVLALLALPVQVQRMTGSPVAVGAIGAVELVPMLVLGLYGGVLADAVDRRRMVLRTELALGLLALGLTANALLDRPRLGPLYAAAAAASGVQGLQQPALSSLLPRVVAPQQLPAAFALGAVSGNMAAIVGTSLAGVLLSVLDLPVAYGLDAASFGLSALLMARMAPVPVPTAPDGAEAEDRQVTSWRGISQGVRYVLGHQVLIGTYLIDLAGTVLALPFALFPFLALAVHASWALGLFYAAGAVGSLAATAVSGWTTRTSHHGRWMLVASVAWAVSVIAVGLSSSVWLTLAVLTVGGAAYFFADLFRTTIWNQTIPDHLRGRVAAVELLVGSGGPAVGDLRAGLLGGQLGPRPAIWLGGLICVLATGSLRAVTPAVWRHQGVAPR